MRSASCSLETRPTVSLALSPYWVGQDCWYSPVNRNTYSPWPEHDRIVLPFDCDNVYVARTNSHNPEKSPFAFPSGKSSAEARVWSIAKG
jgi:hypothetical protein